MQSEEFVGHSAEMKKETPWLASEDLLDRGDVKVEIEAVYKHKDAEFEGGRKETVHAVKFVGKDKQLILNATNRRKLIEITGTAKVAAWKGMKVILYVDDNVKMKGKRCCGLRIKAAH